MIKTIDNNKDYPSEILAIGGQLAEIILTSKTMTKFILASENLLDKDYSINLREQKLRKTDLPISSRVLNNWVKEFLVIDNREDESKWHSFSQIDLAYIHILKACRDFGISIRQLQNMKDSLLDIIDGIDFCLLEIAYTYFDTDKKSGDIYLYMNQSGHCNIMRIDDIVWIAKEKMIKKNFILNLSEVWNEM